MKQNFKRILLVQGIVLATTGVFANVSVNSLLKDTVTSSRDRAVKTILTERLVSFNAAFNCHQIDLHWNISNGNNYDHFFIERSLDGTNFEKVGEVKGVNGSSTGTDYGFSDFVKPATARKNDLYYRLKQIDGDNQISYSKILVVRMYNSRSVTAVSVTPDPAINDILVNVQLKENSFVVMTVRDNNGDLLLKKATHAENGPNQFSLDGTSKLKAGNYQLEVTINSNERMTMQLIKG